jgi:hypothetical protein
MAQHSPKPFRKPAHWTGDSPPQPKAPDEEDDLSPTRYGDWVRNGIAVDF